MAEESISLPGTPEMIKKDGGNSRRNSMGKASSSNSGEKVLPHYLRASTGSCHDFCKYGRKHAFEEKARRPMLKRIITKLPDGKKPVESLESPQRKRTSAFKLKPSLNTKTCAHDASDIIKWEVITKSSVETSGIINREVVTESLVDTSGIIKREVVTKSPVDTSGIIKREVATNSPVDTSEIIRWEVSRKSLDGQNHVESKVLLEKKKTSAVKGDVVTRSPVDTSEIVKREVSRKSPDGENPMESKVFSEKKKTSAVKLKYSPISKSHLSDTPKLRKQEVSSSSKIVDVSSAQASSKAKETNLSAKRATYLKLKSVTEKSLPSSDLSGGLIGRRNNAITMGMKTKTSNVAAKEVLTPPRGSLSPKPSLSGAGSLNVRKHRSLKVVPSRKNQNKIKKAEPQQSKLKQANDDAVQEKTLYVIKMETEKVLLESDQNEKCAVESFPPQSSSPQSASLPPSSSLSSYSSLNEEDQEESEYTVTEAEDESPSECDEAVSMEEVEVLEGENKLKPRKGGVVSSDDKKSQLVKLHFKRGKIVDIRSENNSPRRLKFMRGRVLGENPNIKAGARRSFKRRGVDGKTDDGKPGAEKVVLRHQDAQGKKDTQGLLNNVIEETASKLVETRKSKVKALVGAFETVISLQESKPSANAVA